MPLARLRDIERAVLAVRGPESGLWQEHQPGVAVGTALQSFGTRSMQTFGQPPAQIPA